MTQLELIRNDKPDLRLHAEPQYVIILSAPTIDDHARPLLTKRCKDLKELSTEIDQIKAKLDEILKMARARWDE